MNISRTVSACRAAAPWPEGRGRDWAQCFWAVLAVFLISLGPCLAATYPVEGKLVKWVQPDGTALSLRVFGDEFYGRTTTKDGFTVVFNPADKTYYYATTGPDGQTLLRSAVPAHRAPPRGLPRHLREPRETVAAIRDKNIKKYAPDRAAKWRARVEEVKLQRARAAALAPAAAAGDPTAAALMADSMLAAAPVSGSKVGLMILVQFPDDTATTAVDPTNFPTTQVKMNRYANEAGYADDGNSGSIRDYYYDQSNGLLTHTQAVTPIVTLPNPRNYYNYSNYPTNTTLRASGNAGQLLVTHAITQLKASGFDFSTLSVNASNRVYATSLLFAGSDSGVWSQGLWPHAWSLASQVNVGTPASPRYIYSYQCTNVANSAPVIGTVCHELGHLLMGYPDLYDTDAMDGDSEGVGEHCLMGSGNYRNGGRTPNPINLYLKDYSGWATITDLSPTQALEAVLPSTGNRGYRIRKPTAGTEYFLVENRGAGDKWANSSVDKGILIWHIDEAVTTDNKRQQMTAAAHYEVSVEQADGLFDLENGRDRGDAADLFDASSPNFSNVTTPNADWWDGTQSGISVSVLSAAGASMSARFGPAVGTSALGVSPTAQSVPAAGLTTTFAVSSNITWSWSKDAAWVTSSEAASQTGDQVFTYTVAANGSAAPRSAVITVTGDGMTRTHTITQAGLIVDDHGDTIQTATVIAQNSTISGNIQIAGDNDYFRINVTAGGTLLLSTTGTTDVYGLLLDAAGNVLAEDDDSGGETNFLISYPVAAGTYYVVVHHYESDQTGAYQLVSSWKGNNAALSALAPGSGALSPAFAAATTAYTVNVPAATTIITLTPTVAQAGATVTVNGVAVASGSASAPVALAVGGNAIPVVVTSEDGTATGTCTVTVIRAASADLASLTPSAGTLAPAFASGTIAYTASVANAITSLTVTPTVAQAGATVKVNGVAVPSGTASGAIGLNVGGNTITTSVTAQDGVTTKSYTVTVARAPSGNADLAGLTSSGGALNPVFNSATLAYAFSVPNGTSALTITPVLAQADATVKVNGVTAASGTASAPISLNVGGNMITTSVTAQDGVTTKSYTITVTRAPSSNADLAGLVPGSGALSPVFAGGTTAYTVSVSNATATITLAPTVAQSASTVKVNGVAVASGSASTPVNLSVGSNVISTVVTAQDSVTNKTYTVTVTRAPSANADLGGLATSAGPLSPAFASATTSYSASVPNATSTITLTPTVAQADATVKVNGAAVASGTASAPVSLNVGVNPVTIVVTAQDGVATKTYALTVTRAGSGNANLSALSLSAGAVSPAFNSATTAYSLAVSHATASTTVTPVLAQPDATVKVNGVAVASASASAPIALNPGANVINVIVTAQDGTTAKTYAVTVTRQSALEAWRQANFGDQSDSGTGADTAAPDKDNIPNLLKYGLVIPPGSSGARLMPAPQLRTYAEGRRVALVFTRDPARGDVTLEVLAADSPAGPWSVVATSTGGGAFTGAGVVAETNVAGGLKIVEVRDVVNVADASRRFLRIRASR